MNERSYRQMRIGLPISRLMHSEHLFLRRVPQPALQFVQAFLERFSKIFGVSLMILPSERSMAVTDEIKIYRTLEYLRSAGIATDFFLKRKEFPDEPTFFEAFIPVQGRQRMGHSGYGKSLFSRDAAWGPAIGEAIERWALEHYQPPVSEISSVSAKKLREVYGLDLSEVAGFSPELRKKGTPAHLYRIDEETAFSCVDVTEWCSGKEVKAPLQWFSFPHAKESTDLRKEPVIVPPVSSGAASGTSTEDAIRRALLELIERDAFMIHWMRGIVPRTIDLKKRHTETSVRIRKMAERYALDFCFLYLETDFPTHIVMCVVLDRSGEGPAVVVDAASGTSIDTCMERALLGALGLRPYIRRNVLAKKDIIFKKREDLTLESRAFWWAGIERISTIEPFLQGEVMTEDEVLEKEKQYQHIDLKALVGVLIKKGFQAYVKTICPQTVTKNTGVTTVVVRVPQLQPMHFEEYEVCDFGERLHRVPEELGLTSSLSLQDTPHPFA